MKNFDKNGDRNILKFHFRVRKKSFQCREMLWKIPDGVWWKKTSRMKTQNWNSFTSLLYGIYNNLMTRSIFHLTQSFCAHFSCSTKYRRNKFTECAGVCIFVGQLAHRKCYLLFSVCSRGKKKESNIGLIVSSRQGLQYLPGIFHLVHGKYKHIQPAHTFVWYMLFAH